MQTPNNKKVFMCCSPLVELRWKESLGVEEMELETNLIRKV